MLGQELKKGRKKEKKDFLIDTAEARVHVQLIEDVIRANVWLNRGRRLARIVEVTEPSESSEDSA